MPNLEHGRYLLSCNNHRNNNENQIKLKKQRKYEERKIKNTVSRCITNNHSRTNNGKSTPCVQFELKITLGFDERWWSVQLTPWHLDLTVASIIDDCQIQFECRLSRPHQTSCGEHSNTNSSHFAILATVRRRVSKWSEQQQQPAELLISDALLFIYYLFTLLGFVCCLCLLVCAPMFDHFGWISVARFATATNIG